MASTPRLSGPSAPEPQWASLIDLLRSRATRTQPWLTFHRGDSADSFSFCDVYEIARSWATALRPVTAPGDRVLIVQPNVIDFVGAFFGAAMLDAVAVPVAWPMFRSGLDRAVERMESLVAVADPSAIATPLEVTRLGRPIVAAPAVATGIDITPSGAHPAFIQFTSGTTGAPKGAVISQRAALWSAWSMGRALGLSHRDVGAIWLPFFHDMGLVGCLLTSLMFRFPLHVMTPAEFLLRPCRWLQLITKVRATITAAPNFGYDLVTKRTRRSVQCDLSSLRCALNGSETVHRATIDRFESRFAAFGLASGVSTPVYGLAENTLGACFSEPHGGEADLLWQGRLLPSAGRPIARTEVEVRGEGPEGEIWVRSPSVMSGYFRNSDATKLAVQGDWLRTGDLGVIDDGRLFITGREKDLVIKGGQKFHPYEIERVVAQTVDSAPNGVAAFSTPNSDRGSEDLVVAVELRRSLVAGADKLIRGRLVDELGVRADRIHVVGPGTLPRTTSGKIRRRACAELFEERA